MISEKRGVFLFFYLLLHPVLWILAVSRAGGGGARRLPFQLKVPATRWGPTLAVYFLHKGLKLAVQGLKPAGQSTNERMVGQIRQPWDLRTQK